MHIFVLIFILLNAQSVFAETLKLEIEERKLGKSEILVEVVLPSNDLNANLPLIITQHGSTLDAEIEGSKVRTDEHSKRLLQKAIEEEFAAAVIDAFYTHDIKPDQKHKQPWAADYANGLPLSSVMIVGLTPKTFSFQVLVMVAIMHIFFLRI